MPRVMVFAPSPLLTITVEGGGDGELHLHAGGQGVWQARMARTLGAEVVMCSMLTGEAGGVLEHLLTSEGFAVHAVRREGNGAAYIHDRRGGERVVVAEFVSDSFSRHDADELYAITLREGMAADVVLLSGPHGESVLSPDVYRRLAADLTAVGKPVIVDLAGDRLLAALEGGVRLVKVADNELVAMGLAADASLPVLLEAARAMRSGAEAVIVTRAGHGALLVDGDDAMSVRAPHMSEVDPSGAGDSFTAALTVALMNGESLRDAVALGAAAGALNVTRHGLGTGDAQAIHRLAAQVRLQPIGRDEGQQFSPDELAASMKLEEE